MNNNQLDIDISVENGKYTVQFYKSGKLEILRYGEFWQDLTGDKFVLAMAQEIIKLRNKLTDIKLNSDLMDELKS